MTHGMSLQFSCLSIVDQLLLLQAGKLKAAVIQRMKSHTLQRTPDTSKDVVTKKASLSESKSVPRSSAKSTPQLITPNDNKVLLIIYHA